MVAFTKILKKFDKVSNQQASATYLKAVKKSHFINSDKVVRLMDEVESIFTRHFANSDRKKTMKFLRPQKQKNSHMFTFFVVGDGAVGKTRMLICYTSNKFPNVCSFFLFLSAYICSSFPFRSLLRLYADKVTNFIFILFHVKTPAL